MTIRMSLKHLRKTITALNHKSKVDPRFMVKESDIVETYNGDRYLIFYVEEKEMFGCLKLLKPAI